MNNDSMNSKRPSKIITSTIRTTTVSDIDEKEEKKEKPKESYSSFLIRMLEECPKKTNNNKKKISSTIYNNYYLSKNKLNYNNYNPNNTNYSTKEKKVAFSIDKNQKDNPINAKYSFENYNLNKMISYTDRDNSTKKNETPLKNNNQLNSKKSHISNRRNKYNSLVLNNISTNINLSGNNTRTDFNHNILTKSIILKNINNLKKNKKVKIVRSVNNINKMRLNALYGYDRNFIRSKNYLLKKKDLIGLDNYQNCILKVSQRNLSKDHMFKLFTELQSIKNNANLVKPLPPINYPALIIHSFKEVEERKKHISRISLENKKLKDMDDYEKELYNIRKNNAFKRLKIERNKRLYKIYEILPEHVVDALYKNKNKKIK